MKRYLLLTGAILAEVVGALSMQVAIDAPLWFLLAAVGYLGAFGLLILVLRTGMPVGVVYGIWGAAGVALTAIFAAVLFGQTLSLAGIAGIVLIIVGVALVELGSHPNEPAPAASPKAAV